MEFYPVNICSKNKSEIAVWQSVKTAFKDEQGIAFHSYQIRNKFGDIREIDVLIVHPVLGLWIIECKGCYIHNIEGIKNYEWYMKSWHKVREMPVKQAREQMFEIKDRLKEELDFCGSLAFNYKVALPFITQEQWQSKGFHKVLNLQGVILAKEDLSSCVLKDSLDHVFDFKQKKLTEGQWHSLLSVLCGTSQASMIEHHCETVPSSKKQKLNHDDSTIETIHQIELELAQRSRRSLLRLTVESTLQPETESNVEFLNEEIKELENLKYNEHNESLESQPRYILETIQQPENHFELLIEEDLPILNTDESDEFLEAHADEDDAKSGTSRESRRTQTKKKQYVEDSIRLYLQEIGRIRLLRADEEIELARKIADLLELERVRERLCERLDRDPYDSEWAEAVKLPLSAFRYRLYIGQRAKDKMVQANLRLVVSIAKKYMNRGLSFQDLIQEGSLGLIRAAEKFAHEKGYRFSAYATWWIRQAITRAIADQSRTIRLPVHLYETISRIKKTTKLLSQEMGRKPTEGEIATRLEMTIEKLRFVAKSAQLPISLETPIGKEEDSRLSDFIESDGETPEDQVSENLLREDLEKVLDSLSPRERDILRLRYGLDDGQMKTFEEIGQIFNVIPVRILQIEAKALRKLRHPNRNSVLKEYIDVSPSRNLRQKKQETFIAKQSDTQKNEDANTYVHKGLVYQNHGCALKAIENFTQALGLEPNNAQIYYYRGLAKIAAEANREAIEDFTKAIHLSPQHIEAYYQRGHIYYKLEDSQKAIEDYRQVISLNPDEALAYFYLGFVKASLGDIQEAISNYSQALKINPNLAEVYYRRGVIFNRSGDLHKAIEEYNQALQLNPYLAEAYIYRGLAHHKLENYQEALEDYSQAVQINSGDALIYYYRAFVYKNLSSYIKALDDFNQALHVNPNFAEAYYHRGEVYYYLGNYQKALEDLDCALSINPNNPQAYNKRSSIRAALKDYQGAMDDLQIAAQIYQEPLLLHKQMLQQQVQSAA